MVSRENTRAGYEWVAQPSRILLSGFFAVRLYNPGFNMDRFPAELDELLTRRVRRLLADPPQFESLLSRRRTPILLFEHAIEPKLAKECIRLLDRTMYPVMRQMHQRIP